MAFPGSYASQMIQFHKNTFLRAFVVADMLQGLSEAWLAVFLQKSKWLPAEGVQVVDEWIRMGKNRRKTIKDLMDSAYGSVFAFWGVPRSRVRQQTTNNLKKELNKGGHHDQCKSDVEASDGF